VGEDEKKKRIAGGEEKKRLARADLWSWGEKERGAHGWDWGKERQTQKAKKDAPDPGKKRFISWKGANPHHQKSAGHQERILNGHEYVRKEKKGGRELASTKGKVFERKAAGLEGKKKGGKQLLEKGDEPSLCRDGGKEGVVCFALRRGKKVSLSVF